MQHLKREGVTTLMAIEERREEEDYGKQNC